MSKSYAGIGSRDTPLEIQEKMTRIAQILCLKYTLRSGGARGADTAFENGAGLNKEIYLPYDGFNKHKVDNQHYFLWTDEAYEMAAEYHPYWNNMKEDHRYFHARNMHQVLGRYLDDPVDFVVCWTSDGKASGGTGQAIRVANSLQIPVYNLYNINNCKKLVGDLNFEI